MKPTHHIPQKLQILFSRLFLHAWWDEIDFRTLPYDEKGDLLILWMAYKGYPAGVSVGVNENTGKPIAFTDNGEDLIEYTKPKFILLVPAVSSTTEARVSAIITESRKRNLHRLSAPYPHFNILPLNEPSFTVQNILTVFEGFFIAIFSRPPPLSG